MRRLVPRSVRHGISAQLAKVHASRLASDLGRLAAGRDTIVVGPWLGEVGFELLYWVPFLRWFATTFRVAPERLLIVSRGGTAAWYRPFAAGYRDIFDYLTPEEFRQRHDERVAANGEQKQTQVLAFERQLLRGADARRPQPLDAASVHDVPAVQSVLVGPRGGRVGASVHEICAARGRPRPAERGRRLQAGPTRRTPR